MAAAYFANRIDATATFELFVRELPPQRAYLVAGGLDQALAYLENLHFNDADIAYLRALPTFGSVPPAFFEHLQRLRFTGEVWAMPEGTPAFANEPLLRVTAPILEAQLVETALLALINFQTMIVSKAARVVDAAAGRSVIEFGSRRAHGTEAAMYAARAAYLAGCAGTSNVEAGQRFGIPVVGTIAHSWVMTFDDEIESFKLYMKYFPDSTTLLIDTYDTVAAAQQIVAAGLRPQAVRLDSGDLAVLSRAVRRVLDDGGLRDTRIFASGDLDEWRIADLLAAGAPIDAFGVGTRLATSFDQPALGGVYKLVELAVGSRVRGTIKTSPGKATLPGRKQVWRRADAQGEYLGDVIALHDEPGPADSAPLLVCVMRDGKRTSGSLSLAAARDRFRLLQRRLPAGLRGVDGRPTYPVSVSERLLAEQRKLVARQQGR